METLIGQVLAAWRRAERLTEQLEPGSPEHGRALMACQRLRDLYQELTAGSPITEGDVERAIGELGPEPA